MFNVYIHRYVNYSANGPARDITIIAIGLFLDPQLNIQS